MTTSRLNGILHRLREELGGSGPSDGQLLEGFLSRRDEDAFETLVRRHGPMVLGVCRRLLKNGHDAEDAFQATFLVLVRKAASIRPRELVGHWLYGVAYRTALKAKTLAVKRRVKERNMSPPATHHDEPPADWLPLLDEELQRLPDKYRLPLVLCDLDGKTRKEAARQLGWPDGTLSTRLTRARVLLAERLTRRGVALADGATVLAILNHAASAQVPATLMAATVKAALGFAAGSTATAVSASVAALTQGVLKTMLLSKLKIGAALGLVLAFVGFGVGAVAFRSVAAEYPEAPPVAVAVMPPLAEAEPISARPMPSLALVNLFNPDVLEVIQRQDEFTTIMSRLSGKEQQITRFPDTVTVKTVYSLKDVRMYNTAGKLLSAKEMSRLLKREVTALVYLDGKEPDPQHRRLFKDGTLFLVLTQPLIERSSNRVPQVGVQPPPLFGPTPESTIPAIPKPPAVPKPLANPFPLPILWLGQTDQGKLENRFKQLDGEWRLVSRTLNGETKTPPEEFKDFRMEIRSKLFRMGFGPNYEHANPNPTLILAIQDVPSPPWTFDIWTKVNPDEKDMLRGIYKLEGDELTVCSTPPGEKRPTDFTAPKGSKRVVIVYQRVSGLPPKKAD